MKARFVAALALLIAVLTVSLPAAASAKPESAKPAGVTAHQGDNTSRLMFETSVYNGTGRWMKVSRVDQSRDPGNDWEWLAPGEWSDEYTNIGDVNQFQVPGCAVFAQGRWYSAGTWAKVYAVPYFWVVDISC
jgi:hypothetical protein